MRALVLVAVLTACAIEVDPSNTRFTCAEEPVCPDGFSCVAGVCEPNDAADAAPPVDARPGEPDAEPDALVRPSCDETYGEAPGYILCLEGETTCSFNVSLEGGNCGDLCPMFGGTCEGALDNENAEGLECISVGVDTCTTNRNTEICICSRGG